MDLQAKILVTPGTSTFKPFKFTKKYVHKFFMTSQPTITPTSKTNPATFVKIYQPSKWARYMVHQNNQSKHKVNKSLPTLLVQSRKNGTSVFSYDFSNLSYLFSFMSVELRKVQKYQRRGSTVRENLKSCPKVMKASYPRIPICCFNLVV